MTLGGHYARVRTEARVVGRGASTKQIALYFAGGKQMHDFRTIQDHDAPHTTSDLLFKGAVQDESASVYTGSDQDPSARPGHVRVPDQPQPHARRGQPGPRACRTSRSRPTT